VGKTPARHALVLTFSSFAKEHTINPVPVAAQEFISAATSNGSAVHKLECAEHIPVLCQQVINQSLSFLFALFICHARLRMYLSTRQENPAKTAVTYEQRSKRLTNTASSLNRDKYQCKQRIGGNI
jgi:hypothetical protein